MVAIQGGGRREVRCYRSDLVLWMVFEVESCLNVLFALISLESVFGECAFKGCLFFFFSSVFWLALGSHKKDLYPWERGYWIGAVCRQNGKK